MSAAMQEGRQNTCSLLAHAGRATSQISATSPFQSQLKSSSSPPHFETRLIVTCWLTLIHCPIIQSKYTEITRRHRRYHVAVPKKSEVNNVSEVVHPLEAVAALKG